MLSINRPYQDTSQSTGRARAGQSGGGIAGTLRLFRPLDCDPFATLNHFSRMKLSVDLPVDFCLNAVLMLFFELCLLRIISRLAEMADLFRLSDVMDLWCIQIRLGFNYEMTFIVTIRRVLALVTEPFFILLYTLWTGSPIGLFGFVTRGTSSRTLSTFDKTNVMFKPMIVIVGVFVQDKRGSAAAPGAKRVLFYLFLPGLDVLGGPAPFP
ncbi:MAG: hypothetical protein PHX61_02670 [Alphaproteobacteria bacterium]|nr:hypothetical protein [Alphaproteobacteria bacterium]